MGFTPQSFERAAECFEQYASRVWPELQPELQHLVMEIRDILSQLDDLIRTIEDDNQILTHDVGSFLPSSEDQMRVLREAAKTDPNLAALFRKNPNPVFKPLLTEGAVVRGQPGDVREAHLSKIETRLYQNTVLFYRHAHRLVKALRGFPTLSKFTCKWVSIVRNQLIEHPEGQQPVTTLPSFGWGTSGPRLKPVRAAGESRDLQDPGLFKNAQELREALDAALCDRPTAS